MGFPRPKICIQYDSMWFTRFWPWKIRFEPSNMVIPEVMVGYRDYHESQSLSVIWVILQQFLDTAHLGKWTSSLAFQGIALQPLGKTWPNHEPSCLFLAAHREDNHGHQILDLEWPHLKGGAWRGSENDKLTRECPLSVSPGMFLISIVWRWIGRFPRFPTGHWHLSSAQDKCWEFALPFTVMAMATGYYKCY